MVSTNYTDSSKNSTNYNNWPKQRYTIQANNTTVQANSTTVNALGEDTSTSYTEYQNTSDYTNSSVNSTDWS